MDPLQTGLWAQLTSEQQKAALAYNGDETIMPADAPRRKRKAPRPSISYRAARRNACFRLGGPITEWVKFQTRFPHKWQKVTK